MKNFYTALYTYFNQETIGAHNDFYNDIGGRFYKGEAPDSAEYPYCVYKQIVNTQIDTFSNKMDDISLQFSLYSEKSSSTEVEDAMSHLKVLFDDCTLTVTGGTLAYFFHTSDGLQREEINTPKGIQDIWHYHCDYAIVFERDA